MFGGAESGAGHPGHTMCTSEQVAPNTIRSTSKSGKWQWDWTFHDTHATLEMVKTDPAQPYWFLYEGTPGGIFDPPNQYFGTNLGGPRKDQLDYYAGNKAFDNWHWAYFGHQLVDRVLYIAQQKTDTHSDNFSYLGNTKDGISSPDGMVVFGFGRADGAKPLLTGANTFYLGFWEKPVRTGKDHQKLARHIRQLIKP